MSSVVVRELGHRDPIDPIILVVIDVHPEVLFQFLVDPFGLTVSLRMVGHGRIVLGPQSVIEFLGKLRLELRPSVMDNLFRYSMQAEHIVPEQLGSFFGRESNRGWYCMNLFLKPVNDNQDRILSL